MSRTERSRLIDIRAALEAIDSHLHRGSLSDGLIFDAHRYFDTAHGIVQNTVEQDLPQLRQAVERLLSVLLD